jgi:hypothetical protein
MLHMQLLRIPSLPYTKLNSTSHPTDILCASQDHTTSLFHVIHLIQRAAVSPNLCTSQNKVSSTASKLQEQGYTYSVIHYKALKGHTSSVHLHIRRESVPLARLWLERTVHRGKSELIATAQDVVCVVRVPNELRLAREVRTCRCDYLLPG